MSHGTVEDQLDILRVISLYCHVADDKALDRLGEVFSEDCVMRPPKPGPLHGIPAIVDYYTTFTPKTPIPVIGHLTLDSVIEFDSPTTARGRSKGMGFRADMGFVLTEYNDIFVKTAAGWRIKDRLITRKTGFSTEPERSIPLKP